MAGYRKFWLVNSLGNKYYLTDESKNRTFLNTPTGFGFSANYSTRKINNSELLISDGLNMVDISGELVFYASSPEVIYADYQNFIDFIKFKPLKFHYLTPNFVDDERYSFYANVIISQMSKGEMSQNGVLSVQINIHRLSQWLDSSEHVYTLSNSMQLGEAAPPYDATKTYSIGDRVQRTIIHNGDEIKKTFQCIAQIDTPEEYNDAHWEMIQYGKNYPLMRPYYYLSDNFGSGLEINNTGTDDVGFIFTVNGAIENPMFSLYQNNVRYGLCALKGTYSHVIVDSVDGETYIYLEDEDGIVISNPEQRQAFDVRDGIANFTWCRLNVGKSIFVLSAGNLEEFAGTVEVAFKNSYFSV